MKRLWRWAAHRITQMRNARAVLRAVKAGDGDRLLAMLEQGLDPDSRDLGRTTALMVAVLENHAEIVRMLLDHGVSVNASNREGVTALHWAAVKSVEITSLLLEAGANIHIPDKAGNTALLRAADAGNADVVTLLLQHGAEESLPNKQGNTAVLLAAGGASVSTLRILLEQKADLHACNTQGKTALMLAVEHGRLDNIRLLLDYGADIDAVDNAGKTALRHAIDAVRSTLSVHWTQNQPAWTSQDLLQAIRIPASPKHNSRHDCLRLLLERGADVNVADHKGRTIFTVLGLDTISYLVDQLECRIDSNPQMVAQPLPDLGPNTPNLLMAILRRAKRRRNGRYLFLAFWLPATAWVLWSFAKTFRPESMSASFMFFWLICLPSLILLLGVFVDASTLLSRTIQNTVRALIRLQDRHAIGPLVEALDMEDGHLRRLVAEALTGLLPHLHASDAGLLTPSQRSRLYRVLQRCSEPSRLLGHRLTPRWLRAQQSSTQAEFAIAILKALEQVGDEKALPYVERLAACPVYSPTMERVRIAARDCLPFLQTRIAQVDASQTLLRPSGARGTLPNQLLYPVLQSDPLPDLLVRPSQELPASG